MQYSELAEAGFTEFGESDTGGGYDWGIFAVWLKDGVFWWAWDCGCSCNGPWDFGVEFEGHGNAHDAIKALNKWSGDQYTSSGAEGLLSKLLDYRPAKDAK